MFVAQLDLLFRDYQKVQLYDDEEARNKKMQHLIIRSVLVFKF